VSDHQTTLLSEDGHGASTLRNAVTHCLAEVPAPSTAATSPAVIAGIGTTAPHALRGALLLDALARYEVPVDRTLPFANPAELVGDDSWDLALVLSPWKQQLGAHLTELTASATRTGVVDTVVRGGGATVGVNTNSWAAQAAMETLLGGRVPTSILVLGSGGSSNSVALAARRAWPTTRLVGSARNADASAGWADRFAAESVAPDELAGLFAKDAPTLLVNTTTWGETDASQDQPFAFDFAALTAPGNSYFDLNNRVSALQITALQAGMNVMSGTFMQRVTNACRAALLTARSQ
jgi:shikimate dehydrogenase